jgi:cytochrome d ubiquinol oxidase subunit I
LIDHELVTLSRLQFALTALYHFLFVPLTLGLAWILAIMEAVYVMTGREIWKRMTQFWGVLFGINFAMGVATGVTMEFQFGTNWAYYAHYVGDVFGTPLAIEGLMAFFLEATFVGLFFFGWDRLSKVKHLIVTTLLAIGTNLSALWILIANAWMQNPVGAEFNLDTMRMEVTSFATVMFNPVAQSKFVHTVSAGYVLGSMFVLSISAWYLLRGRNIEFAKRSMWETEPAPASFTAFGWPDVDARTTHFAIHVPYVMGIIGTRSLDGVLPGINQLVEEAAQRIEKGRIAYAAMQRLRADHNDAQARADFDAHKHDLGYALLLRNFLADPAQATAADVQRAAVSTIPNVPVLFWSFRLMVGCGLYFIALFGYSFWLASKRKLDANRWYLKLALWSLPLPWLAAELGWIVAEYGRQPWAIEGILPTALGVSSISSGQVLFSLCGFVVFYTTLAVVDGFLMTRYARRGPDGLGLWPAAASAHANGAP